MQPGTTTSTGVCTDRSESSQSATRAHHVTRGYRRMGTVAVAMVAGLPLALVATSTSQMPAAAASASKSPITIAYISSLTGEGGSEDGDSPQGFEARLDEQNAQGGIDGHKLVPLVLDDQTSPSLIDTVVQEADSKAFGIVSQSPLFFLAAKYPNEAGVPVTGSYDDGPEWGTQPYTNMFASDEGSVNPKYPVNTQIGDFLKAHGGTILGSYGYGISPSSSRAAIATADSFEHAGGKTGVLDTSVPFGSVAFTSLALVAKQKDINAMVPAMDANSNYALAQALAQAGVKLKATLYATGYQPNVINSTSWKTLQGSYFLSPFRPWALPNAGDRADAGRDGEVRTLHQDPVPGLRPVRGMGGRRPHDQGPGDGGTHRLAGNGDQGSPQHQVLQRQRSPAPEHRLRNDLRPRPPADVCLGHEGRKVRIRRGLLAADVWDGHPGDGHRQLSHSGAGVGSAPPSALGGRRALEHACRRFRRPSRSARSSVGAGAPHRRRAA